MGMRPGKARGVNVGFDSITGRPGYTQVLNSTYSEDANGTSSRGSTIVNGIRYGYMQFDPDETLSLQGYTHPNYNSGAIRSTIVAWDRVGVIDTFQWNFGIRFDPVNTNLPAVNTPDAISVVTDGTVNKFYWIDFNPTVQGTPGPQNYYRIQVDRVDQSLNIINFLFVQSIYGVA